jgi:hypothetical protein
MEGLSRGRIVVHLVFFAPLPLISERHVTERQELQSVEAPVGNCELARAVDARMNPAVAESPVGRLNRPQDIRDSFFRNHGAVSFVSLLELVAARDCPTRAARAQHQDEAVSCYSVGFHA